MEFNQNLYIDDLKENSKELQDEIIALLSENGYTISQTRGLFAEILETFERRMPVTNVY